MIFGIFSSPHPYSGKGNYQVLCIKREDLAKTKGHFFFPLLSFISILLAVILFILLKCVVMPLLRQVIEYRLLCY